MTRTGIICDEVARLAGDSETWAILFDFLANSRKDLLLRLVLGSLKLVKKFLSTQMLLTNAGTPLSNSKEHTLRPITPIGLSPRMTSCHRTFIGRFDEDGPPILRDNDVVEVARDSIAALLAVGTVAYTERLLHAGLLRPRNNRVAAARVALPG